LAEAKQALHVSNGEKIIGRENEIKSIKENILKSFKLEKSASFYISGVPGTGKNISHRLPFKDIEEGRVFEKNSSYQNQLCGVTEF